MENAVEALKTAFAVLVFIIAITTSFTMFGKAKKTVDSIVTIQDKQGYLETPTVDGGILYTSSSFISNDDTPSATMTKNGDRIVGVEDVISTIYRYNLEKYGVTIVKDDGTVLARFDSNTENIMRQWYNITEVQNEDGTKKTVTEIKEDFAENIKKHLANQYVTNINFNTDILKNLYKIKVEGNNSIEVGAPWYGNEAEIIKRCNCDIQGIEYKLNNQKYTGKGLYTQLTSATSIIEVVNEIDNSKYVKDEGDNDTTLLQEYQLPTIEIIYIIQ